MPRNVQRSITMSVALSDAIEKRARAEGIKESDLLRAALERLLEEDLATPIRVGRPPKEKVWVKLDTITPDDVPNIAVQPARLRFVGLHLSYLNAGNMILANETGTNWFMYHFPILKDLRHRLIGRADWPRWGEPPEDYLLPINQDAVARAREALPESVRPTWDELRLHLWREYLFSILRRSEAGYATPQSWVSRGMWVRRPVRLGEQVYAPEEIVRGPGLA